MPKTKTGQWSLGLFVVFIIFFTALTIAIDSGQRGGDAFFDNMLLAMFGLSAALACVASFIAGVVSIFKLKERSWLLFITTFIGLLVTTFILGEVLFPH